MSTPMHDIPDHFYLPYNAAGEGPADDDEAVLWGCWCAAGPACTVLPARNVPPDPGQWGTAPGPQQPDEVCVELPSGGRAQVSSDAPASLLRALDALSRAAQQDHPAQPDEPDETFETVRLAMEDTRPDEVSDGSWIREEFERAKRRQDELPAWARPVVTRPAAPSAQPDEVCGSCRGRCGDRDGLCSDCRGSGHTPAQPVRDTGEGRR